MIDLLWWSARAVRINSIVFLPLFCQIWKMGYQWYYSLSEHSLWLKIKNLPLYQSTGTHIKLRLVWKHISYIIYWLRGKVSGYCAHTFSIFIPVIHILIIIKFIWIFCIGNFVCCWAWNPQVTKGLFILIPALIVGWI